MKYDVAVLGGGLAGSSTAVHLARRGHRVVLFEKRRLPAHKLCGEFFSVETQDLFERLGLTTAVHDAGAHPIRHVRITTPSGTAYEADLPGTALGLSRYVLDHALLEHARAHGVEAFDGTPVHDIEGSLADGFTVHARGRSVRARCVVGAYGKRATLDRKLDRAHLRKHSPFVAFKAHYAGADLADWIELHAFVGGYCGLSHIEGGRINACWISRDVALKRAGGDPEAMVEEVLRANPALDARFQAMERVSATFCAVSQVTFDRRTAWTQDICMVGDTAGMIAPMCGDGMAMALRSAEVAAPLLDAYLQGEHAGTELKRQYEAAWRREFGLRMRLGRWLHHAYCRPAVSRAGVKMVRRVPALGRWLIRNTRG